ncbi:hypothetical protein [Oceanisphaera ostreae]|uniref:HemY N-terminal domain-containing protein n=1 Tax=Oceanisphaera ostreae TaxID=914151 RepID=A0ABW3KER7_9GAMM
MNPLPVFKLIRPHLGLLFSSRFIVPTLLFVISISWLILCYLPLFESLGFTLNNLPIYIYTLILLVFLLAAFISLGKSPTECWLLNKLNLAIHDLRHEDIEQCLALINKPSFLFMLPASKVQLVRLTASFYTQQGNYLEAYNTLQNMQQLPLRSKEWIIIQIQLMHLYYAVGNLKACQHMISTLQSLKLTFEPQLNIDLQQVELDALAGKYQQAKDKLEELYAIPKLSVNAKVAILHTLAVVDTHLGNYEALTTNYRQAWDLQKNQKNNFAQAERTVDNLILSYAKQGELAKINPVFEQLQSLASNSSLTQQLALHNIKLNLARQLNDRQALLQVYADAEKKLRPQLQGEQKFAYIVNSLRMHFNDNVNFAQTLQDTQQAMLTKPDISTLKTLRAITEISGTLKQAIATVGPRAELMTFFSWLLFEFKRLESKLDRLQDAVPPNLPSLKAELISLKVDSLKNTLMLMLAEPNQALFERMFELLEEKKNLWQGMSSPLDQLNELLIILDEYQAYKKLLHGTPFETDFKPLALKALEEAKQLANNNPKHLAYSDKLIGLAYACYQLNTQKTQAKQWLDTFDKTKLSLNHNAVWLREQYEQANDWVNRT